MRRPNPRLSGWPARGRRFEFAVTATAPILGVVAIALAWLRVVPAWAVIILNLALIGSVVAVRSKLKIHR